VTADDDNDKTARLRRQLALVVEADRLKRVLRRTVITDRSRHENSAEHSWHLALYALTLAPHAPAGADVTRAVAMLLLHDVVEVRAGDTFAYDAGALAGQHAREALAADELFGMVPDPQGAEFRALWDEFEAGETPTARFANALDRLQPLLANVATDGGSWRAARVTLGQVQRRMAPIEAGCPALWPWVCRTLDAACAAGFVEPDAPLTAP